MTHQIVIKVTHDNDEIRLLSLSIFLNSDYCFVLFFEGIQLSFTYKINRLNMTEKYEY